MRGKALKNYGTVAALVVIIGIFGLLRPASFFTLKNFLNITRQAAPLAMVALGATFVMTVNEFDLSIGNIVSLGGVVAALLSIQGVPIPVCFLAAVVAGLIVGCVNGVIVAKFGILSFITTLGMGTVLDGVIYGLTGGTTVFNGIPKAFTIPGILKIAGIPFITIVAAMLYIVFHMFMNHMSAGRKLYAIGGRGGRDGRHPDLPLPNSRFCAQRGNGRSCRRSRGISCRFREYHSGAGIFLTVLRSGIYRMHRFKERCSLCDRNLSRNHHSGGSGERTYDLTDAEFYAEHYYRWDHYSRCCSTEAWRRLWFTVDIFGTENIVK